MFISLCKYIKYYYILYMKISKHISFFYIENKICYINRIIDETNNYEYTTDIFIHTNKEDLQETKFNKYTNGSIKIVYHDLSNIHPYYLTWKCRDLLKKQRNDYDIFMYIEDDILVPYKAIKYWLTYNEKLIEKNYNLGFFRIEIENKVEYITDIWERLKTVIHLDGNTFCVNNINPYCAFWIYNKKEFSKFVESKYWNIENIHEYYGIREKSAVGLHGVQNYWYINTLLHVVNNKIIEDCKIYHMPNNYAMDKNSGFGSIKFDNALEI